MEAGLHDVAMARTVLHAPRGVADPRSVYVEGGGSRLRARDAQVHARLRNARRRPSTARRNGRRRRRCRKRGGNQRGRLGRRLRQIGGNRQQVVTPSLRPIGSFTCRSQPMLYGCDDDGRGLHSDANRQPLSAGNSSAAIGWRVRNAE